ncbi:MAG: hypothetical protein ACP5UQ_16590 [Anaerolineae bacterium]
MEEPTSRPRVAAARLEDELRFLTRQTVRRVDDALCRIGSYGEVRLIVIKGRLRFIQTVHSEEVAAPGASGGET